MKHEKTEKNFVLKISEGTDVFSEIKNFVNQQPERFFAITAMQGRIKDFELMSAAKHAAQAKKFFKEPNKIINITGMIEKNNDDVDIQIHVSVTKDGFSSSGGKLLNAKAANEIQIGLKSLEESKAIRMW